MFKHILLPLDGSKLAESAIPFAVKLCKELDTQITLLHVIEKDAPPEIHGQHHLTSESESSVYLDKIAAGYFAFTTKVKCHVHTEEVSQVAASIVDHSSELKPDLIILTSHGEGGLRDFMVGSIAQQVIAAGKVSVLLTRPDYHLKGKTWEVDNILVPLDGDPHHDHALKVAGDLAKLFHAILHLIRVVPTFSTLSGEQAAVGTLLPATTNAYLEIAEEEASDYLQKKLESSHPLGVKGKAEVQRGEISREVVNAAEKAKVNLIVLGTHGKAGLSAFWAGSVAPKIVAKTNLPILLVPVRRE